MVRVLVLSAVDLGVDPVRVSLRTMRLACVASPISTQHQRKRSKTGWIGIRIMCPSGAACISVDCCFCELALLKSAKRVDLVQNDPYHHFIDNQLVMAMT